MEKCYNRRIKNFLRLCITILFFINILFCKQKSFQQISSDITEFDRVKNIVKFFGNVRVNIEDGYIMCDEAEYDEINKKIFCNSNVYAVVVSTKENYSFNIKSYFADYDFYNKIINFKKNVYLEYENFSKTNVNEEINKIKIKCDLLNLQQKDKQIFCKGNIEIFTQQNMILCSSAKYMYDEKMLFLDDDFEKGEKVKFVSLDENLKLKSCSAKKVVVNIKDDKIYLYGETELRFYQ
ncbi:MAG: hypothetical protein ACK4WJ_04275 [Endomicrobiia bacterium]